MFLYDYHTHSWHSSDGTDPVRELCSKALAANLNEIAITDHFEPTAGNEQYPYYKPDSYFYEVLKARAVFGEQLNIKYGVELGQPHRYPEFSEKLIETHPYDYVLASAHKMDGNLDFGEIEYDGNNSPYYCEKYLDEVKKLAEWNKFDCIGHLDLPKRYAAKYGVNLRFMDFKEQLEEIFGILIRNGKGIEINTSGLRQHAGECLPDLDIVAFYKSLGGEILTVGSDAHCAADVGAGVRDGIEMAKAAGFEHMTVYTNRKPYKLKISDSASPLSLSKKFA